MVEGQAGAHSTRADSELLFEDRNYKDSEPQSFKEQISLDFLILALEQGKHVCLQIKVTRQMWKLLSFHHLKRD